MADQAAVRFERPTFVERLFGRALGALIGIGVAPGHMHLLSVHGRKSGALFTTPVDLLDEGDKLYLVAPRGKTQWVRNAEAAGEVQLKRGGRSATYRLRSLSDAEKPPILKAYLDRFPSEVQRFFPLPKGSPVTAFAPLVQRYPAFEITPLA